MKFIKYLLNALLILSVVGSAKAELSNDGVILCTLGAGLLAGGVALGCSEEAQRYRDIKGVAVLGSLLGTGLIGIVAVEEGDELVNKFSKGISKAATTAMNFSSNIFNSVKTQVTPYLTQAGNIVVEQTTNVKDYLTSEAFLNDRLEALNFVKTPAGKIIVAGTLGTIGAGYCVYKICKNLDRISPVKLTYNEKFLKTSRNQQNKR